MNFQSELVKINQKLSNKGVKIRIEQRGNKLNLRGQLPSQKDPKKTKEKKTNSEDKMELRQRLNPRSSSIPKRSKTKTKAMPQIKTT